MTLENVSTPHTVAPTGIHGPMITITHTHLAGTLATGTSRGDGTAVVFKAGGWRWSQHLTAWYLPHSRDRDPNRSRIDATAQQLRAADHAVTVGIDDTTPSIAEREADLSNRGMARAAALRAKADQAAVRECALAEQLERLRDRMPLGQPILVDHPAAGVVRRHYEKVTRLTEEGIRAGQAAGRLREAAAAAEAEVRGRYAPLTVANRIARLETEHRNAAGAEAERLEAELDFWCQVRVGQIAAGRAVVLGPDSVAVGDQVRVGSRWYVVTRVNAKTVTVAGQLGRASKLPYARLDEHRVGQERSA